MTIIGANISELPLDGVPSHIEMIDKNVPFHELADEILYRLKAGDVQAIIIVEATRSRPRAPGLISQIHKDGTPVIYIGNALQALGQPVENVQELFLKAGAVACLQATAVKGGVGYAINMDMVQRQIELLGHKIHPESRPVLKQQGLDLDPASKSGTLFGQPLSLTKVEYDYLAALAAYDHCRSKEALLGAIYSADADVDPKIVDVYISKLRSRVRHALKAWGADFEGKLLDKYRAAFGEHYEKALIRTHWGMGYELSLTDLNKMQDILDSAQIGSRVSVEKEIQGFTFSDNSPHCWFGGKFIRLSKIQKALFIAILGAKPGGLSLQALSQIIYPHARASRTEFVLQHTQSLQQKLDKFFSRADVMQNIGEHPPYKIYIPELPPSLHLHCEPRLLRAVVG